jgi:hypothetical protein
VTKAARLRALKATRYGLKEQLREVQAEITALQRGARQGCVSVTEACHAQMTAEAQRCGLSAQEYADRMINAALDAANAKPRG